MKLPIFAESAVMYPKNACAAWNSVAIYSRLVATYADEYKLLCVALHGNNAQ